MHLLEIVIYSNDGRDRRLAFEVGRLNVVSGESELGKSALLEIVRYCLGSEDFRVPAGVIADKVSWYGLRVQLDDRQAFLGRPRPPHGKNSTTSMMMRLGITVSTPTFEELEVNSNAEAVMAELGRAIGIGENEAPIPERAIRKAVEARLDHALTFCFQRQGEIANQDLLFHRQGDQWVETHIRDVLPYFLGAVPPDYVVLQDRHRRLSAELRRLELRRMHLEGTRQAQGEESSTLLVQAQDVGLLEPQDWSTIQDVDELRRLLSAALDSTSSNSAAVLAANQGFDLLQRQKDEASAAYRELHRSHSLLERSCPATNPPLATPSPYKSSS